MEGISIAVLLALFLLQKYGTSRVSFLFSPIMGAWTFFTPIIGVYSFLKYYPTIFKALSPHYIVQFFLRNGRKGWELLGGTILCITGMAFWNSCHLLHSNIWRLFAEICSIFSSPRGRSHVCWSRPFQQKVDSGLLSLSNPLFYRVTKEGVDLTGNIFDQKHLCQIPDRYFICLEIWKLK